MTRKTKVIVAAHVVALCGIVVLLSKVPPSPTGPPAAAVATKPAAAYVEPKYVLQSSMGTATVIVWRDAAARSRGADLIRSGIAAKRLDMMAPLVSCIVDNNTPVELDSVGFVSRDVTVSDGAYVGCTGNIDAQDLHRLP